MGLFDVFKKKEAKKEVSCPKINLRKEQINKICLEKKPLNDLVARVVLAVDYSGSMDCMYENGEVQEVIERIFPIALKFDDDGEMGVWKFSNDCKQLKDISINNYKGYVEKEFTGNMGGTNYSPVISDIREKCIKRKPLDIPTYVIFITDGDCFDKAKTEALMYDISSDNIFWQFVGIGNSSFGFLEKLDDMEGRFLDNADFFSVKDINEMSDENLYSKLLNEFPKWIEQAREKNIIK
jgi:hypothetical protein